MDKRKVTIVTQVNAILAAFNPLIQLVLFSGLVFFMLPFVTMYQWGVPDTIAMMSSGIKIVVFFTASVLMSANVLYYRTLFRLKGLETSETKDEVVAIPVLRPYSRYFWRSFLFALLYFPLMLGLIGLFLFFWTNLTVIVPLLPAELQNRLAVQVLITSALSLIMISFRLFDYLIGFPLDYLLRLLPETRLEPETRRMEIIAKVVVFIFALIVLVLPLMLMINGLIAIKAHIVFFPLAIILWLYLIFLVSRVIVKRILASQSSTPEQAVEALPDA